MFQFEKAGSTFNFHNYYEEPNRLELEVLRKQVAKKVSIIWKWCNDKCEKDCYLYFGILVFIFRRIYIMYAVFSYLFSILKF